VPNSSIELPSKSVENDFCADYSCPSLSFASVYCLNSCSALSLIVSFSSFTLMNSGSPSNAFSLSLVSREWQSRHNGMYISAPPIKALQVFGAVLNVNEAFSLHSLQIADSFLTFSQRGINSVIFFQGPLKKVPCNDEMITIFWELAAFSANYTISVKNYPSSMPITS